MTIRAVPFTREMMELFEFREEERGFFNEEMMGVALESFVDNGEIFAAVKDGRILVVGGIVRQSNKTGYCFTVFSKYADGHTLALVRALRRFFFAMIESMDLHRLVTYNKPEAVIHHKWCEWLGFEREALVRKFDDFGNDYVQYGLVI